MDRQETLSAMRDWATYGVQRLVYIKPIQIESQVFHALYAADGTQLVIVEARALAEATIRQHAFEPLSVH